jgi:chromate reductase, NAD(P)H dehydrogenase (quinone)
VTLRIDLAEERVWKDGVELHLRRKPFAILKYLARHPQHVVTQAEIIQAVWGDVDTSQSLLRTHMRDLRQVLGDDVVETVVGRGYRFLLDASWKSGAPGLHVLVFAASFHADSLNQKLAGVAAERAKQAGASVDVATLQDFDVPQYDGEAEDGRGIPAGAEAFARRLAASDAFILISPEYNASMPGGVKNIIDWTSHIRPQPFDGRHALLLSASVNEGGGRRGLSALRVPLEHLGVRVFPETFSLGAAHQAFADGDLADQALQARLERTIRAFLALAEAAKEYPRLKRAAAERATPAP